MLLFMIVCAMLSSVQAIERCSNDGPQVNPEYYLVKKCHRSKLSISARANFTKLSNCKQFALAKKALSFNISPQVASRIGHNIEYTCEVLQCTEIYPGLSLTNDSRYDYYSLYGNISVTVNSTCVPSLGMFYFVPEKRNNSQSIDVCHNMSSVLADVTSADRTNALAQLLADVGSEEAFISLKRSNSSDFIASNGEQILIVDKFLYSCIRQTYHGDSLECTSYRAWAPGHPRKQGKADCVSITRQRTWRSVSCEERLAALCEIIPGKTL